MSGMRREKTLILSSVPDRRENQDRTEIGPRPVGPILWDRRSRFGPVDRQTVGLWPSLVSIVVFLLSFCPSALLPFCQFRFVIFSNRSLY